MICLCRDALKLNCGGDDTRRFQLLEDENMQKSEIQFQRKILQMGLISLYMFLRNVCVRFSIPYDTKRFEEFDL